MEKTIVLTGAQGNIGKKLRTHLESSYNLRLLDLRSCGDPKVTAMDLSEWNDNLLELFSGADAIIHMAADPDESKPWSDLIGPNLDALNNTFIAAIKTAVPRVIFASSNHAMGGYSNVIQNGRWLNTKLEPKPGTRFERPVGVFHDSTAYGAMKVFGERLGMCYAQSTPGVCIAIRIGWLNRIGQNRPEDLPEEANEWYKRMWISNNDMYQLMDQCITVTKPPGTFLLINGMSDNDGMVWDLDYTKESLGYSPQDGLTIDFKDKNRVKV